MDSISRNDSQLSDDSTQVVDQEETSSMDNNVEWTDEKHSLYLKSMEASFVDQLYNLKDVFSWSPGSEHRSGEKLCRQDCPSASGQLKVQQHCHLPEKSHGTAQQPIINGNRKFLVRPWIKHFKAGGSPDLIPDKNDFEHHQVSLKFDEECSGQNFADEDHENKASSGHRAKRMRSLDTSTAVNNDQVVPFGILVLPIQDSNVGCSGMQPNNEI